MAKKTPPWPPYDKWTTARYFQFIRSALRSASLKWPPIREAKVLARRKYVGPNKMQKWEYQCAECKGWFLDKQTVVDHIIPAGTLRSHLDLPRFVERLFVGVDGLRVLCKDCHQTVTNNQRANGEFE